MSMRSALIALLNGESTVTNVVGSRIYFGNAPPDATFPHIVVSQESSDEMTMLDGTPGLRSVRFDISSKSERGVQCETLGDAVRKFLDDYTGTAGSETIDAVYVEDESTNVEPPRSGEREPIYVTTLDVVIQYTPV